MPPSATARRTCAESGASKRAATEILTNAYARRTSVARDWTRLVLDAFGTQAGRPTVHARNMYHVTLAMHDAWWVSQAEERDGSPLLETTRALATSAGPPAALGTNNAELAVGAAVATVMCERFAVEKGVLPDEVDARRTAMLVAAGADASAVSCDLLLDDTADHGGSDSPMGQGVAVGRAVLLLGRGDGSFQDDKYMPDPDPSGYEITNKGELDPWSRGDGNVTDPSLWQRLKLGTFIDKNGDSIEGFPTFTTPHWGNVTAYAFTEADRLDNGLFVDPGPPPMYGPRGESPTHDAFVENHTIVAEWSGLLDPFDGVEIDISPRVMGNADLSKPFDSERGGDVWRGHPYNPYTGLPYEPNRVRRGDYGRVLTEFWADADLGRETPSTHWLTIFEYVLDHPAMELRHRGRGSQVPPLEYHVKSFFALAATMHDTAINVWAIKRFYDSARPYTAIRHMCTVGQCSDPDMPRFDEGGIMLRSRGPTANFNDFDEEHGAGIEVVTAEGLQVESGGTKSILLNSKDCAPTGCLDQVAIYGWDPISPTGNRWMAGDYWWPYMRVSFITPSFPGYVSGHSTFARAAADVLTDITGSPYFPGGIAEYTARQRNFLEYGPGPANDTTLQWATYLDAADSTGLSRIYGGVHPPCDDRAGREMGSLISAKVWAKLEDELYTGRSASAEVHAITARVGQLDVTSVEDAVASAAADLGIAAEDVSVARGPPGSDHLRFWLVYSYSSDTGERIVNDLATAGIEASAAQGRDFTVLPQEAETNTEAVVLGVVVGILALATVSLVVALVCVLQRRAPQSSEYREMEAVPDRSSRRRRSKSRVHG